MSRASVIVSLLIAVVLTGVSIVTLRQGDSPTGERQSVLELDAASVTALSVARPRAEGAGEGGAEARVERGRLPGQWLVRTGEGEASSAWPIAAERMRAALRVLAELRGRPVEEGDTSFPAEAATLTVEREGGEGGDGGEQAEPVVVRIAPPGLGGRRLVEVDGQVWEIEDWLHEAFVTSGPLAWRDTSAMPGVSVEASRIALVSGSAGEGNRLTLTRAGGRWALTAPVGARADAQRVEALLGLLGQLQVARFYDEPPADDITGLDEPLAQVRVQREMQIPEGPAMRRITESATLTVGGPIDTTNSALFARIEIESSLEGAPRGEAVVAVSAEDLNRINPLPEQYIALQAVGAPASEIGGIQVAPAGSASGASAALERTRDGWALKAPGGEAPENLGADRAQAVTEAVNLLCEAPAGAVLITRPEEYEIALTVTMQSLGGSPLQMLELGAMPSPRAADERYLVIRDGEVYRVYQPEALGTLELLQGLFARPTALPEMGPGAD